MGRLKWSYRKRNRLPMWQLIYFKWLSNQWHLEMCNVSAQLTVADSPSSWLGKSLSLNWVLLVNNKKEASVQRSDCFHWCVEDRWCMVNLSVNTPSFETMSNYISWLMHLKSPRPNSYPWCLIWFKIHPNMLRKKNLFYNPVIIL